MSDFTDPGSAAFRDLPPGPHSGVPTDPDAQFAPDPLDKRIRSVLRSHRTWIVLVGLVLAIGVLMSLF